jgi:L-threonylcarbamoyladenylate synthase
MRIVPARAGDVGDAADAGAADEAIAALLEGRVVVVPTDTVYGLAALPSSDDAVRSVYRVKQRPEGLHLPVLAAGMEDVRTLGVTVSGAAEALAARWWPGPLTMVFSFEDGTSRPTWLAERVEVAVRVPDHELLRSILARTGPLFVTSANPHGSPTAVTASAVVTALRGSPGAAAAVALVVDGGRLTEIPSTLVNMTRGGEMIGGGERPVIEREGAIPASALEEVLAMSESK